MTQYVLEHAGEFERLERQSSLSAYDPATELGAFLDGLGDLSGKRVVDLGCGAGTVSRFLAARFPQAEIVGLDASAQRLEQATRAGRELPNLRFEVQDATSWTWPDDSCDVVVVRYVLQHLPAPQLKRAVEEIRRCLRPGGSLLAIDIDGAFLNLHPVTSRVERGLAALAASPEVDMRVGRKLPALAYASGFTSVRWEVQTMSFSGAGLEDERRLIAERFEGSAPFWERLLGSTAEARAFREEYLALLREPGTVLFYDKFVVHAC